MSKDDAVWQAIQESHNSLEQLIKNQQFIIGIVMSLGNELGYKFESEEEELEDGKKKISGVWKRKSGIILAK